MSDERRRARVQRFYDEFADSYDCSRYGTERQLRVDRVAKQAFQELLDYRIFSSKRVLDCGCGTGRFSRLFTDLGAEVTGVDSSPRMLEKAREKVPQAHFELGDVLSLSFHDEFDLIISSQVLTHLQEYSRPLAGMKRALKADGVILIDIRNLVAPRNLRSVVRAKFPHHVAPRAYDPGFTTLWAIKGICADLGLRLEDWRGSGLRALPHERTRRVLDVLSPTLFLKIRIR